MSIISMFPTGVLMHRQTITMWRGTILPPIAGQKYFFPEKLNYVAFQKYAVIIYLLIY